MKYKITILALLVLILLTGCQSNLLTGKQILVTPAVGTMKPGQTLALEVMIKDRTGKESNVTPTWVVENSLGTLDRTSGKTVVFTATAVGTTRIKVTANGLTTFSQITIVEPVLTQLTLSPSGLRMGLGQTKELAMTVIDQFGDAMTVSPIWTVNPLLGTVDANQHLTATNIGRGTVTVTVGSHSATLDLAVEAPVDFPDPVLKNVLLQQLKKKDSDLFPYELEQVTELTVTDAGIANLDGLQYCTDLTTLDLESNEIVDLQPLSKLAKLTDLNLRGNKIEDVTPLAFLTGLRSLMLGENELMMGLKPLERLTSIERLDLSRTGINDLQNLYGMEKMRELYLSYNSALENFEVIIHMQDLKVLDLKGTIISSLEPLNGLVALTDLDIRSTVIGDITPLETCTALTTLLANDNGIRDIAPLANLISLERLNLSINMIQDLTPLQGLVNLNMLYLAENQIDDISPLVQNSGLGKGDLVDIEENPLDLTDGSDDRDDIQTLIARGVVMIGF